MVIASYSCLEINNGIKVMLIIKAGGGGGGGGHTLLLYSVDHCPHDGQK